MLAAFSFYCLLLLPVFFFNSRPDGAAVAALMVPLRAFTSIMHRFVSGNAHSGTIKAAVAALIAVSCNSLTL